MKKYVLFALFCISLILLMPMISSIETKLVKNDNQDKIKENVAIFQNDIELDIFNLIFNKLQLFNFIKILIFLELGFAIGHTIMSFLSDGDLSYLYMDFLLGLLAFPFSIQGIYNRLTWNIDYFEAILIILMYIMGAIIVLLIENINPNFQNYIIGLLIFGMIYPIWFEAFISED